tara:strand:+ start:1517 stop:2443 length:927 start_codon:yes stop_codon:yes gene_type:complete
MASTYTSITRLEKQGDGENPNTWGTRLNQNVLDLVDQAIGQYTIVSVSSAARTLTVVDGAADESRSPFIELQGTITTSLNVIIPNVGKSYVINDNTTRSDATKTITLKTATGSGTLVKPSRISQFICDSVSVHPVEGYTSVGNVNAGDSTTFTGINVFSNLTSFTSATSFATSVSVTDLRAAQGYINRVSVSAAEITNASVTRGIMTQVTLTDAASISLDLNTGNNFIVTLAGNRALSNPSNPTVGQTGHIYVIQDGTGVRTLSFGTQYKFPGGDAPTMTSAADSVDMLVYNVRTAALTDVVFIGNFS